MTSRTAQLSRVSELRAAFSGPLQERVRFLTVIALLVACAAGGGASRPDVVSLLYVRPLAILCIGVLLLMPSPLDLRSVRTPLILIAALAAIILLQLVPLPPDLWLAMPGHERYAGAAAAAGLPQPWRPISLAPDLTLNSLLAVIPPLAALIGFAALRNDQRAALVPLLMGLICASAFLGILQLTGSDSSPAYFYAVHHPGSADGFFANRNHHAVFLALVYPLMATWVMLAEPDTQRRRVRSAIGVAIGLFMIPMILITESRAGIFIGLAGLASVVLFIPFRSGPASSGKPKRSLLAKGVWVASLGLVATAVLLGRALSLTRLATTDVLQEELRLIHLPRMIEITREFFPFGIGFGAFDPVFRGFEPDTTLRPLYFNRAHNDVLELVMTGGLPAVLLALAFLVWWGRTAFRSLVPLHHRSQQTLLARLGVVIVFITFLGSVADYPLRTPLMGVVFALACGWMACFRKGGAVDRSVGKVALP